MEEKRLFQNTKNSVGIDFEKYDQIPVHRSGRGEEEISVLETFDDVTKIGTAYAAFFASSFPPSPSTQTYDIYKNSGAPSLVIKKH